MNTATSAAEVRKQFKTQAIRINPSALLTDKEGSFVMGQLLTRRDVPYEGKTFKVYDIRMEAGDFAAFEGKEKKAVKVKPGDIVSLKGTARINWAMSNIADGAYVLVEYHGLIKSPKKGQNDAHDFTVEIVQK